MTTAQSARIRALSIISIMVVIMVLLLASASHATGQITETHDYRVKPGDTLWQIAHDHGPDGADRRAIVASIDKINDLDGGILQAGQVLMIPVVSSS